MVKIVFTQPDGRTQTVEAACGQSLMRAALENNVEGVAAECGGACACGTCQVVVVDGWAALAPPPAPLEVSMLEAEESEGPVRLSCQITVTEAFDGLVVAVPERRW